MLNFELPDLSDSVEMGRDGFKEAELWPLLPTRIMTAGEPVNRPLFKRSKAQKGGLALVSDDDLIFVLEMRKKPEDEWSLTQRRRYSQLVERISKE